MKPFKKVAAVVYLLASLMVLGSYVASLAGPFTGRMRELERMLPFRVAIAACLAIIALQALYVLGLVLFSRPAPKSVRPGGAADIEVTLAAVASAARTAAAAEPDVLVEDVDVRARGREAGRVDIRVEAIALSDGSARELAHRVQSRVDAACERLLGAGCASCRVRFLPAKTVTLTKEVPGE